MQNEVMYTRLLKIADDGDKSFFLFGPRGTGKTTWVKRRFPEALYLDLLKFDLYNDLLARPGRLENLIPPNFQDWIILDELKMPSLSDLFSTSRENSNLASVGPVRTG